jgi:glycerol-3-phosphate acyltransferase PlsY
MTVVGLFLVLAYLIGAIPTSYIVGRMRGIDLRERGSGNLGATNAFRVLGWKAALPIFVLDIAKGWFPTFALPIWDGQPSANWAMAYGAAAIVGHVFSIYVGFKGGKGVATSAGVLLALAPVALLIGLVTWTALVWTTGYVSLASMIGAIVVAAAVWLINGPGPILWLTLAVAAFVIFAHRANLRRLMAGTENRFSRNAREAR